MEPIDNNKIVMSLLRQCAWVWEHCTKNPNEGEFNLKEIMQGFGRRSEQSAPGMVRIQLGMCNYWDVFNKMQPIDGLVYNHKTAEAVLTFGTFKCCYKLSDVFRITMGFCEMNCPSMANKVRFCYKDGERWTVLPEGAMRKMPRKSAPSKPEKKGSVPAALSLTEQLRAALLARLAA